MSVTSGFDATPWARGALLQDPERTQRLAERARMHGAEVQIVGKNVRGPWTVRIGRSPRVLAFRGPHLHDMIEFGLERWEAGADDRDVQWVAGSDGLAHAQPLRRSVWTLCKRPVLDQRYRHPERSRCEACWRALDRAVVAA